MGEQPIGIRPGPGPVNDRKQWFYPQWEPRYLILPGRARRPAVVASIAWFVSGSLRGTFVK